MPTARSTGPQEHSSDLLPVLDPVTHTASTIKHPVLDPKTPSTRDLNAMTPSAYWGEEPIWDAQADNHNPMMDEKGRPWFTVRVRPPANNPAFCRQGSEHPSAKTFPLNSSTRQTSMYDPVTRQVHADRPVLPHPSSDLRGRRRQHLVVLERRRRTERGRLAQPPRLRRDRRPCESAGLVAVRARHQRQRAARRWLGAAQPAGRSAEGQARRREFLQRRGQSAGRIGLGPGVDPVSELRRALRSEDAAVGNLFTAVAGLRRPWRRHRPQRRVLDLARERPPRPVRPPQVQGAQRSDRDRRSLPGRLDAAPHAGARLRAASTTITASRRATTPGSIGSTSAGSARTCRLPPAT